MGGGSCDGSVYLDGSTNCIFPGDVNTGVVIANFSPVALPWPKMYPARVPNGLKLDPSPPPVMPPAAARDAPSAAVLVSATRNGWYSLIS